MPDNPIPPDDRQDPRPLYLSSDDILSEGEDSTASPEEVSIYSAQTTDIDPPIDLHEKPTLPLPEDAEEIHLNPKTLPGSGGFDPNPDFLKDEPPVKDDDTPAMFGEGVTMPHIVPFEHTMVHVPGENRRPAPQRPPRANPSPTRPEPTIPMPPTGNAPTYAPGQPVLPPRNPIRRRRGFLGCSPGCLMIFAGVALTFCGGLTLLAIILTATLGTRLEEQLNTQIEQVGDYENFQSTFYYDRQGALLYETFNEGRRVNVAYENFPQDLINATVATEDDSFWSNPGFEVQATTRAFLQYVGLSEGGSGGSTITQQLVRNVLFDAEYRAERSINRKVEEIVLAFLLSRRMTKQEVLGMYLNEIYYGNLAYGAQAAAQVIFGKDVSELTLGEAALLAGLPQAPANLDPLNPDPDVQAAVLERWRVVLERMVEVGYISPELRDQTIAAGLTFAEPQDIPLRAPHFTMYARQELETLMGELGYSPDQVARGGLRVYTTVDLQLNDLAQQTARAQIAGLTTQNVNNGAVLVIQPTTGQILAMVGSVDYNNDNIDGRVNVTISPRQPGSTMKPFTYAAALELGMTPGDIIWDTPFVLSDYQPVNYDRSFHGPVRMRGALANSYNIPALQTLRDIGVPALLEIMARFGTSTLGTDASQYGISLTLGGGDITLLELTRAYAVFANGGVYVPTTSVLCIIDRDDNIIYQYEQGCPRGNVTAATQIREGYGTQVLDPRIAFIIGDILADEGARQPAMGAQSALYTGSIGSSVKTGTTDNFRDNWTVGFTRNVAVGVWVGNTRGEPMINTSGLTGAAPIWNQVITAIYNDNALLNEFGVDGALQADRLDQPPGVSLHSLCAIRALTDPALDCGQRLNEWMLDSPAARWNGQGLDYPPATPAPNDQPPGAGPWLREVEPDIYRVLVSPLPPDIANLIQFQVGQGQAVPPPPIYCQVPVELQGSAPAAREQLFIAPPPYPDDAARAEQYARAQGYAFLPTIACTPELLSVAGNPTVVTAFISSPAEGQTVSGDVPIMGTAQFSSNQAVYYKLELSGGQFGGSWVTLGEVHPNSVVNGQLEVLPGSALQPGQYSLQLVVVGLDGNYVQQPYRVTFNVQ